MKKILLLCVTLTMAFASATTHKIVLYEKATLNGKELKAGEYKVEIDNGKIVMKLGKTTVEAPIQVENTSEKYVKTAVRYLNSEGKYQIKEIRVGGTNMKVTVN